MEISLFCSVECQLYKRTYVKSKVISKLLICRRGFLLHEVAKP